jgi:hypothetical protein
MSRSVHASQWRRQNSVLNHPHTASLWSINPIKRSSCWEFSPVITFECAVWTQIVFLCFACYQSKERSFPCRFAALLITATLTVGMLGLNLTWGVNTSLRFVCVILFRKRSYDGPIPHPCTTTRCLQTRFRIPCNQQEAPGHVGLRHRIYTDMV